MDTYYAQLVQKLIKVTLKDHLAEISLDNSLDLYDVMVSEFFKGNLDSEFESKYLDDSNKEQVLELAKKYNSLCFYKGGIDWWTDSVEGVTLEEPDLVLARLFDNYDYLIKIAKDGGEDVLKFLLAFKNSEFADKSSIIDALRNYYADDEYLETILIEMSKKDGEYKDFSEGQKILLYDHPEGLLFEEKDGKKVPIPAKKLLETLKEYIIGDDESITIEEVLQTILLKDFAKVIDDIYGNYQDTLYEYEK